MGSKKLKTAAEAAGYAMVNPEDFANEPKPLILGKTPRNADRQDEAEPPRQAVRWWPGFDLFGMSGGKATA